ncbi:hypothetical protein [Streptomyces sp. NPDC005322]|uniref:hypothetical protein n=1 Tax=unclassified Streptomyces TaxID=2593676 RepID=UPI0033A3D8D8
MGAETVIAVCAVVVAAASLAVSVSEARATRQHNRHSVRPILQLHWGFPQGRRAGVRLINAGLGPAVIVSSTLVVDDEVIGVWNKVNVDRIRDDLSIRPSAVTFSETDVLAVGYEEYLLSVANYEPQAHAEFKELISRRLSLVIRYESLYGGEDYQVTLSPSARGRDRSHPVT